MSERAAIVNGVRTPFCRAGGIFRDIAADDLGAYAVKELMGRTSFPKEQLEHLIFGNVLQPSHAANIARVIAVKAGMPLEMPAVTVNRNCASGLEAITEAATMIAKGRSHAVIAGGVESMSNFPILFNNQMRDFLQKMSKAKGLWQQLSTMTSFRFGMLKPILPEIGDPLCGLSMGQTAEILAREYHVTRQEQDAFALASQQRAEKAMQNGYFNEEIVPMPLPPDFKKFQKTDDGIRINQTLEMLAQLKPAFERPLGTATAGNASQVTDGAAALLMLSESKAKEFNLTPMGYVRDFEYVGLDPSRMGLGPAVAIGKLLSRQSYTLEDFDLIEINEAFAAQVIACEKALASLDFAKKYIHQDKAVGVIDRNKLNVNGGAISLGHPLGASGARLVLTVLHELKRRNQRLALVALCIGGGQGAAAILEVS